MAIIKYTEATGGAPTLSGTNGALVAILDIALLLNGWAIEYSSGNGRIYRPGTGNRFRLAVFDDSAVSGDARAAVFRGCENATGGTSADMVDPFPLVAQVANNQQFLLKSSTANGTARNYTILVAETWVRIFVNSASGANAWETMRFGDVAKQYTGDTYNTTCSSRNGTSLTAVNNAGYIFSTSGPLYWARSIDGLVKSSLGNVNPPAMTSSSFTVSGQISALKQPLAGYGNTIDGDELSICDYCSTTTTAGAVPIYKRAWIPNTYAPLHAGNTGVAARDIWDNGAGRTFEAFVQGGNVWLIQETSDTWVKP